MSNPKQDALLKAVAQTILHLNTTLELSRHPSTCVCYGCNLKRAYFDIQIAAFSCGTAESVPERE